MVKAPKIALGTFMRIPLGDGTFGYGRALQYPYVAFYDLRSDAPLSDTKSVGARPVLFRLSVRLLGGHDRWPALGKAKLEGEVAEPVTFFTQDDDNIQKCTIYDTAGLYRAAAPEECVGLERSAVWDPHHVEERLLDHFEGRENETEKSFRVRLT
ncbi:Imm26 family immunity protein [Shinella sp.]|uniref:Imm26 family immunity protein n=1 Tax=Shinella sp. TaxID=1870904 RepID=UPI003F71E8B7